MHGDLRSNNIIVHKRELSIRIIDWDWAGKIGEATYPASINMDQITWPKGVSAHQLMTPQHDMEWYNRIKLDLDNNLKLTTDRLYSLKSEVTIQTALRFHLGVDVSLVFKTG